MVMFMMFNVVDLIKCCYEKKEGWGCRECRGV
jgi:hypothetical protein